MIQTHRHAQYFLKSAFSPEFTLHELFHVTAICCKNNGRSMLNYHSYTLNKRSLYINFHSFFMKITVYLCSIVLTCDMILWFWQQHLNTLKNVIIPIGTYNGFHIFLIQQWVFSEYEHIWFTRYVALCGYILPGIYLFLMLSKWHKKLKLQTEFLKLSLNEIVFKSTPI